MGMGVSGNAAARLLRRHSWCVTVSDSKDNDALRQQKESLAAQGITVLLGTAFTPDAALDLVVVSPGVPWDAPPLVRARELGVPTVGEPELAWRFLKDVPWVGITGTNGKTTTTALIAAIFQAAGLHAPACGNIGHPLSEVAIAAADGRRPDWVVAELSSYQIEGTAELAPRVGVFTTFTPDHLERHRTMDNYFRVKAALLHRCDVRVLNGDDPELRRRAGAEWPAAVWTSAQGPASVPRNADRGVYVASGWVVAAGARVVRADALRVPGGHNRQNLLMAVAAAVAAGVPAEAIAEAVAGFEGVPHRLQTVRRGGGLAFVNDSKATNYDSAQVGLDAFEGPVILIAGGQAKEGTDSAGWLGAVRRRCAGVVLIGRDGPALAGLLRGAGFADCEVAQDMGQAVRRAAEWAGQKGVATVLLSPACASFDQYRSFEHRGEHFQQLCLELPGV